MYCKSCGNFWEECVCDDVKSIKTGVELIANERKDQKEKHGFDAEHDADHASEDLTLAAIYLLTNDNDYYPADWHLIYKEKFDKKDRKDKLIVAGALIAAEIDRSQNKRT